MPITSTAETMKDVNIGNRCCGIRDCGRPMMKNVANIHLASAEFIGGIHWRNLDEDVSFESFEYDDAEPSVLQRFFLTHNEINVAEFARMIGMNPTLLRNYINGFKKPSEEREQEILGHIRKLGEDIIRAVGPSYPQNYESGPMPTTKRFLLS